jgi:hypothetical protein
MFEIQKLHQFCQQLSAQKKYFPFVHIFLFEVYKIFPVLMISGDKHITNFILWWKFVFSLDIKYWEKVISWSSKYQS